jgi:hypothetical protein
MTIQAEGSTQTLQTVVEDFTYTHPHYPSPMSHLTPPFSPSDPFNAALNLYSSINITQQWYRCDSRFRL